MSDKNRLSIVGMLEAIEKIEKFTKGISDADEFFDDQLIFDGCLMNFIIIGEMVGRLDESFKESNNEIEWEKIWSFRNIVAHNYFGIDANEVWQIIRYKIPILKAQLKEISSP
jgi:uncharacterized protein with HEPN domain